MTNTFTTTYRELWRRVPREIGFMLLAYPLALAGFIATITLFTTGLATLPTFFIGVLFIVASLYISRGLGTLDLTLLEWAGQPAIERPHWDPRKPGFMAWLTSMFGNGHYWLYLLYSMVVNALVTLFTWTITIIWIAVIANGLSYWFWGRYVASDTQTSSPTSWLLGLDGNAETFVVADSIVYFVLAVIFTLTLPFVSRGLVSFHHLVARGLLGAFASDALRRQVGSLAAAGVAASSAEGHSLRRLERDIHDGPQQRLVRLQMDLAAAERHLESDPDKARTLIAEAMVQSKEALEELRALSRGFAPPILLDRGLIAALESAAVRSPLPTSIASDLPIVTILPQEIERNAYFIASEAIVNAGKHSGASAIEARVSIASDNSHMVIVVADDGVGGAVLVEGHGLSGLEQRVLGLSGTLDISSPEGGPTVVTALLPFERASL
ncbi:MAG: sensor histidine kinase [Microbacteriaceae bacterium]